MHELFQYSNKTEQDQIQLSSKKIKAKIKIYTNNTPEPISYLNIHSKKQSPVYKSDNKNNKIMDLTKNSPTSKKVKKSHLFPEISRRDASLGKKISSNYMKKKLEIRINDKPSSKFDDDFLKNLNKNPSLSYEVSTDNLMKSSVNNSIMSNRHSNLHKKEFSPINHFKSNMVLPHKFRLKQFEVISSNSRYKVIENSISSIYK